MKELIINGTNVTELAKRPDCLSKRIYLSDHETHQYTSDFKEDIISTIFGLNMRKHYSKENIPYLIRNPKLIYNNTFEEIMSLYCAEIPKKLLESFVFLKEPTKDHNNTTEFFSFHGIDFVSHNGVFVNNVDDTQRFTINYGYCSHCDFDILKEFYKSNWAIYYVYGSYFEPPICALNKIFNLDTKYDSFMKQLSHNWRIWKNGNSLFQYSKLWGLMKINEPSHGGVKYQLIGPRVPNYDYLCLGDGTDKVSPSQAELYLKESAIETLYHYFIDDNFVFRPNLSNMPFVTSLKHVDKKFSIFSWEEFVQCINDMKENPNRYSSFVFD